MKIATVISYCTNDYRFIGKCIEEAQKFSDQIIIPVSDHFFDGTPENRLLLEHTYAKHPNCLFVEFAYSPSRLYNPYLNASKEEWSALWILTGRYIGYLHTKPGIDAILFLDSDEIVDGDRFLAWLKAHDPLPWNALRFLCYYYVLRPDYRATKLQDLTLLVRKSALDSSFFFNSDDRYALFREVKEPKARFIRGQDQKPLIHHYSWVRPKDECLHKSATWGHRHDENWPELIEKAFAEKNGRNLFGNDLQFEFVPNPYFNPLAVHVPKDLLPAQEFCNVKKVDHRTIFQMELQSQYQIE